MSWGDWSHQETVYSCGTSSWWRCNMGDTVRHRLTNGTNWISVQSPQVHQQQPTDQCRAAPAMLHRLESKFQHPEANTAVFFPCNVKSERGIKVCSGSDTDACVSTIYKKLFLFSTSKLKWAGVCWGCIAVELVMVLHIMGLHLNTVASQRLRLKCRVCI